MLNRNMHLIAAQPSDSEQLVISWELGHSTGSLAQPFHKKPQNHTTL